MSPRVTQVRTTSGPTASAAAEKQDAAATWKKTYGHHPLMAFVDHGRGGSGEPVAALLRPGNAGANRPSGSIGTGFGGRAVISVPVR